MRFYKFLTLTFCIMISGLAQGQTAVDAIRIVENEIGFGTRALGMGGAYAGSANDYSAVYWNPAGLADVQGTNFFGEVSHLSFNNNATFSGTLTEDSQNYTRLRSVGIAYAFPTYQGSFAMAFGYNRVKDFDQNLLFSGFNQNSNDLSFEIDGTDYLFDQDVDQFEQISDDGGLDQWNIGAGVALSPNFNAGVTATVWSGSSDYQFSFRQEDNENNFSQFPADFDVYRLNRTLITDYSALSLKFGGMFHMPSGLQLGVAVGLPVTFHIDETFTESDLLIFDDGTEDPIDGDPSFFEYEVQTPLYLDAGASFSLSDLTLAGSIRYRDWSQTKFKIDSDLLDNPDYVDLLDENRLISQDYDATMQYNLGGELFLRGFNTKVRAGYAVLPSPVKNTELDLDRTYITAGLGFQIDRFVSLDVAYLRSNWEQESEDNFTPGGTLEDITTNKILVGLNYSF